MSGPSKLLVEITECQEALRTATGRKRAALLERMGDFNKDLGKIETAIACYKDALMSGGWEDGLPDKYRKAMESIGKGDDVLEVFKTVLAASKDPVDASRLKTEMAFFHWRRGEHTKGKVYGEEAIAILRTKERGDQLAEKAYADAYNVMGLILWDLGELTRAKERFETVLASATKINDQKGIIRANNNIGLVLMSSGDLDGALRHYETGLEISKKAKEDSACGPLLNNIGLIRKMQGAHEKAEEKFMEARKHYLKKEDKMGLNLSYVNLAATLINKGDMKQARRMAEKALLGFKALRDEGRKAFAIIILARAAVTEGDLARAGKLLDEADTILKEVKAKETQAELYQVMTELALAKGQADDAERFARKGLQLARETQLRFEIGRSLRMLATALNAKGDIEGVRSAVKEAKGIFGPMGCRQELSKLDLLEK
jgi:tetratricopeptide (TPR) repeat protein